MNIAENFINYIKGSQQELKKVVWPSQKEIIRLTILVIAISLGVAFFLGAVDYVLALLLQMVL